MGSPLQCDLVRFQTIYKDLQLFPLPNHDRIEIIQSPNGYYPTTRPRGLFPSPSDSKSAEFALSYFEANFPLLSHVTNASEFFLKFTPVFYSKPLANRFSKICEKIFQGEMLEIFEPIRKKVIDDLKIECEDTVKTLRLEIADLQMKKDELKDTLFVCQQGEKIHTHFNTLKKIQFFESYCHSGMKKVVALNVSEEDKTKYPNIFDFSDFGSKTLLQFLSWVKDPDLIKTCHVFEELCELYRLSDYLGDDSFQTSCLNHLNKNLDDEKTLLLLSTESYPAYDRLIQQCCQSVAKKFKWLAFEDSFLKIKHEYLIEILKNDKIYCEEIIIFNAALRWLQAHSKDVLLMKEKALFDCIRFQFMDPKTFLSVKDQLTGEVREKWYEFYFKNKIVSQFRCPAPGLKFHSAGGKQIDVKWTVPIDDYKKITNDIGRSISAEFSLSSVKWAIDLSSDVEFLNCSVYGKNTQCRYLVQFGAFNAPTKYLLTQKFCIPYSDLKCIDLDKDFVLLKCQIFME